MLGSVRKYVVALPHVSVQAVLAVGTVVSFLWLLAQDQIHPLVTYVVQLYLTF